MPASSDAARSAGVLRSRSSACGVRLRVRRGLQSQNWRWTLRWDVYGMVGSLTARGMTMTVA